MTEDFDEEVVFEVSFWSRHLRLRGHTTAAQISVIDVQLAART